MTTPDWYQADDDDSDRARSNTAQWRDRGAIIAQQQTRIAQLEAQVARLEVQPVERVERGPIWGRTHGFNIPVRIHPDEASARAAAADVTKGGTVVVWRNAENGWEEV